VKREPWSVTDAGAAVQALGGFPGAYRVPVPGHTPGSQIVVAFVASPGRAARGVVIAGDIVNHRLGFARDVDKPLWYRWLIVREDAEQQAERRALLHALDAAGFEILVSHDLPGAESGLPNGQCPGSDR
jgi:glyoxylase-like metal-dependent hydrolase (beta-lactamase superfamily II)